MCSYLLECHIIAACQGGFDVDIHVRKTVKGGFDSCIGGQAGCLELTGRGGEGKSGQVCVICAHIDRSFCPGQPESGLFGKGEFPDNHCYGILTDRFERKVGRQSAYPYVVGVEYAVGPFGIPPVISDGAVSDEYGVCPERHGFIAVSGQCRKESVIGFGPHAVGVKPDAGTVYPDACYAQLLFEQFGGLESEGQGCGVGQGVALEIVDGQVIDGYSERVGELDTARIDVGSQRGRCNSDCMYGGLLLNFPVIQQNMACKIDDYRNGQQNMDYLSRFHNMQM